MQQHVHEVFSGTLSRSTKSSTAHPLLFRCSEVGLGSRAGCLPVRDKVIISSLHRQHIRELSSTPSKWIRPLFACRLLKRSSLALCARLAARASGLFAPRLPSRQLCSVKMLAGVSRRALKEGLPGEVPSHRLASSPPHSATGSRARRLRTGFGCKRRAWKLRGTESASNLHQREPL